ncbi:phage tail assembly chaperone [Brevundimonas sp. NPDC058933]|uniref:phage tail assembly chaperone n=1 Tax=Brevundimonas sp. NPDC058933 TaxID=3346673 RepID=UPI003BEEE81E
MEKLEEAPIIEKASQFYWNAMAALSTERPPSFGGGLQPIPLTSIIAYADFLGMTRREADYLVRVIRNVDAYRCNRSAEKAKKRADKAARKDQSSPHK